ncbi:MAG: TraR/DksA family transcriptional regulator [Nitrincola lacisaponensis]|uniref:TraR/DksA family transcriptional regulator n=1 Tax=Nitrincola lacisaponensis TaxID=267850 RepID=UPI0039197B34
MSALVKDRFLSDCRRELLQLHTVLMQELAEAAGKESQQGHLLVELRACEEAIKRIDIGSFGRCKICGEAIELNRLKAEPTTSCCLSCSAKQG